MILKGHGAADREITIIISSIAAILNFAIGPVVSFRSDRTRTRWGRRIPYLVAAMPFAAFFLVLTPHAPAISEWLLGFPAARRVLEALPLTSPVIAVYALLVALYQVFHLVTASIYFYLFRDVVPAAFLGRFLALFRVFGSIGTFIINYWLLGMALTHTWQIFTGVALFYAGSFAAMCFFVREGRYPEPAGAAHAAGGGPRWIESAKTFVTESYGKSVYLWTYLARMMLYATVPVQAFLVLFPQRELGLELDRIGKLSSWGAFAWLPFALPLGWLIDRWGPIRVMTILLWVFLVALGGSFLFVTGEAGFFVSSLVIGAVFPMLMLAQIVLAQHMFPADRMGQFSSANSMLQAVVIALVIGPGTGVLLDALRDFQGSLPVPFAGELVVGPYRLVYLILAVLAALSLLGIRMARRQWLRWGGPKNYTPPG
ncbi:MAG: MFS transporter [Opitutaceae bacterium]|nr:MFS transporter [Opitutaceae bacterium]